MFETKDIKKIALVTGYGKFPIFICQAAKEQGIEIVVIAVKGETDVNLVKYAEKIYWIDPVSHGSGW